MCESWMQARKPRSERKGSKGHRDQCLLLEPNLGVRASTSYSDAPPPTGPPWFCHGFAREALPRPPSTDHLERYKRPLPTFSQEETVGFLPAPPVSPFNGDLGPGHGHPTPKVGPNTGARAGHVQPKLARLRILIVYSDGLHPSNHRHHLLGWLDLRRVRFRWQ